MRILADHCTHLFGPETEVDSDVAEERLLETVSAMVERRPCAAPRCNVPRRAS